MHMKKVISSEDCFAGKGLFSFANKIGLSPNSTTVITLEKLAQKLYLRDNAFCLSEGNCFIIYKRDLLFVVKTWLSDQRYH
ncbi:hypothetical protein HNY73_006346 [Argiope bruennichi]|uniref:Uncharacterized protein n=1 Tax=Argiope bruennichi TaxID=94029 RepID=A0A8T0FPV7_ARGBR|nr:hypothetical protein HNY73_006346 [Argiope bruennichi]